jgi:hypothetical protein
MIPAESEFINMLQYKWTIILNVPHFTIEVETFKASTLPTCLYTTSQNKYSELLF